MRSLVIVALAPLLSLAGCAPQQSDVEYRLTKLETERDELRAALDAESGKSFELAAQSQRDNAKWETDRAELSVLRQRVAELEKNNRELATLVEKRSTAPIAAPKVSASPLPPEIDQKLLALEKQHAGRVIYDRGRGAVSFVNDRLFEAGSDAIQRDAEAAIGDLTAITLRAQAGDFDVIIVGHTDDSSITRAETLEKHPSNWHLSVHRAIAFKNMMVSVGLKEDRVGVMGYGPTRPVSGNREDNRRIEVYLVRRAQVASFDPVPPR